MTSISSAYGKFEIIWAPVYSHTFCRMINAIAAQNKIDEKILILTVFL